MILTETSPSARLYLVLEQNEKKTLKLRLGLDIVWLLTNIVGIDLTGYADCRIIQVYK